MSLLRDFRYALRTLRKSPGFALTSIAVLALGIGANTAIFSAVYAIILKPLPYPDPSRLVFVWQRFPGLPEPFSDRMMVAPPNYKEWQRQSTVFQEMAAFRTVSLDGPGGKVSTTFASPALFDLLGSQARRGGLFHTGEVRVAVISDAFFERRFHRDPKALGQSLTLDETPYTVIGVLPASFYLPRTRLTDDQPEVLAPLPDVWSGPTNDSGLLVAARLRKGVSLEQARSEMAAIAARLEKQNTAGAEMYQVGSTVIFPFSVEAADPSLNQALYLLLGAVALVLLIACANLANLTLARVTLRSREIMVRLAMGATRGRVMVQLLCESLLISLAGAACGVLIAFWSIGFLRALQPPDLERPESIAINLPVLAFTVGAAGLTAILFGLGPALAVSGKELAARLRSGGGWGSSAVRLRGRQFLIACEVALALMLLTGAGLMIRSLRQITSVGVGFNTMRLTALDINLPEKRYPDGAMRARFIAELLGRARNIPGVEEAAVTTALPLHSVTVNGFHISGRPDPTPDSAPVADTAEVSPTFFRTIGLRLEAGRGFTNGDTAGGVAMVNRSFAEKYFPGDNPVGQHLLNGDRKESFEIVGVVSDFRPMGAENGARPEIFRPSLKFNSGTLVVRSRGARETVGRSLLDAARAVAPDMAADKVKTLDEYANYWTAQRKFNTLLLEIFAALALLLAMIGIYGVLSNLVTSRTREIGIRMAVGATPSAIGRLVVRQSLVPVAIGIAAGIAGSMALGQLVESLLFQVPARDPLTLAAAVVAILATAPIALWIPVRRATGVDCTVALREE